MTDFAAFRPTQRRRFTSAVGREIVMMQVTFIFFGAEAVDFLGVARCSQRRQSQHLSLTAFEQTRTMHARDDMNFRRQWTNVGITASIGAHTVFDDAAA